MGSIKGVKSKKRLIGTQRGTELKLIHLQGMKRIVNSLLKRFIQLTQVPEAEFKCSFYFVNEFFSK